MEPMELMELLMCSPERASLSTALHTHCSCCGDSYELTACSHSARDGIGTVP
jgi:hypothetical protein